MRRLQERLQILISDRGGIGLKDQIDTFPDAGGSHRIHWFYFTSLIRDFSQIKII